MVAMGDVDAGWFSMRCIRAWRGSWVCALGSGVLLMRCFLGGLGVVVRRLRGAHVQVGDAVFGQTMGRNAAGMRWCQCGGARRHMGIWTHAVNAMLPEKEDTGEAFACCTSTPKNQHVLNSTTARPAFHITPHQFLSGLSMFFCAVWLILRVVSIGTLFFLARHHIGPIEEASLDITILGSSERKEGPGRLETPI